ncbi:hypothetical protein [Succinimonas sp.]|uniref:hypothetical protein n=1 Tax=Succinimonas sp. TaxID=1936151 RepID=UPI0038665D30
MSWFDDICDTVSSGFDTACDLASSAYDTAVEAGEWDWEHREEIGAVAEVINDTLEKMSEIPTEI